VARLQSGRKWKRGRGGHSLSPYPFSCPPRPSGKVFCSAARSAAIKIRSPDFRQKSSDFVQKIPPTAPIVQWIEYKLAELGIEVRLFLGALQDKKQPRRHVGVVFYLKIQTIKNNCAKETTSIRIKIVMEIGTRNSFLPFFKKYI
jgi:hypothetical protein